MSITNYMNPASFNPQPELLQHGFLGGMQYGQQMGDHAKIMQVQHFLQQLAAKKAEMEQNEFQQAAPLRQAERDVKMETLQGQMPHARALAGAQSRAGIAEHGYNTKVTYGPEMIQEKLRELKQKLPEQEWTNYQRSLAAGATISQTAIQIAQSQGIVAAQAYVQQQKQHMGKAGIQLPSAIDDPKSWPRLFQAARDTVGHMQKMDEIRAQGDNQVKVANIQASAVRDAADARGERNANLPQELVNIMRKIARNEASPQEIQRASSLADLEWAKKAKDDPEIFALGMDALGNTPQAREAKQELIKRKMQWKNALLNGGASPAPSPANPGNNRAPGQNDREIGWNDHRPQAR